MGIEYIVMGGMGMLKAIPTHLYFAHLIAPVVALNSIILSSNIIQNGDIVKYVKSVLICKAVRHIGRSDFDDQEE